MEDKELERLAWLRSEKKSEKGWAISAGLVLLLGLVFLVVLCSISNTFAVPILAALLLEAIVQPLLYWNHKVETKRGYEKELLELKREQKK